MSLGEVCPRIGSLDFIKGDPVDVQQLIDSGNVVVLELFATWCGPCHQCIPHVSELQRKYPQVTFIAVSCFATTRDTRDKIQGFVSQYNNQIIYKVASDTNDSLGVLRNKYRVQGIPHAFVIADGKVQYSGHPVESSFASTIEQYVNLSQKKDKLNKINEITEEQLKNSSIKELKQILSDMRVSPEGCLEKSDLVNRILEYRSKV